MIFVTVLFQSLKYLFCLYARNTNGLCAHTIYFYSFLFMNIVYVDTPWGKYEIYFNTVHIYTHHINRNQLGCKGVFYHRNPFNSRNFHPADSWTHGSKLTFSHRAQTVLRHNKTSQDELQCISAIFQSYIPFACIHFIQQRIE